MLESLTCDHASFKAVKFHSGLNLVIADKTVGSAQKGTRNGSGKSTLIDIIHFCLGANRGRGHDTLAQPDVQGWKFTLAFVASGRKLLVTRSVGSDDLVVVGDTSGLALNEDGVVSREGWNEILAELMFGIIEVDREHASPPSFRQLIRYFARPSPDAMLNAFETVPKQSVYEVRVITAFLLRLDWELALKMKAAVEQQSQLAEARRAVEGGAFDISGMSSAKLQAEEVRLEAEIEQATDELKTFRVHLQYREIESEASRLTTEIQEVAQQNYGDRQLAAHYREQGASETSPDIDLLIQLYREAGIQLSEVVSKTLSEAKAFHQGIVEDRRKFLISESRRLESQIAERERKTKSLSDRRAMLLSILQTHGALGEFEKLSSRVEGLRERISEVSRRRSLEADLNQKRLRLNVEVAELRLQSERDVLDRSKHIGSLQRIFGSFSNRLYGRWQHSLEITAGKGGYKFDISAADRGASEGINHAAIFCYDVTLASLWAADTHHPGFVIHDSSLFDPIEERQIEQALIAMDESSTPFQYICTLNTDRLPARFASDQSKIVLRLTDRGKTGGLLGIRF